MEDMKKSEPVKNEVRTLEEKMSDIQEGLKLFESRLDNIANNIVGYRTAVRDGDTEVKDYCLQMKADEMLKTMGNIHQIVTTIEENL